MSSVGGIFKEAAKYSVPTALSAALSLVLIPVISHAYPASEYGVINLFYSLGNLLMTFALFGLDNAFIRFYQEPINGLDNRKAFSLSMLVATLCIVIVTFCVCLMAPDVVAGYVFGESNLVGLVLLGAYSIALVVFRLLSVVTRQEFNPKGYNFQQIGLLLSNKVLYVLAAFVSTSYMPSITLMTALTVIMAVIFLLTHARKYITARMIEIPKKSLRKFFAFALPTMPAALLMWINSSIAKLVLAGYGRFEDVGVFALAFTIANAFQVVPAAFSVYWSPFIYRHYNDEQDLIKRMQGLLTALTALLVIVFIAGQDIIYLLVGNEYAQSQSYFMIVMLFPIQTLLVETIGYGIYLSNKTYLRLVTTGASAAVNVLFCMMLIPAYGGMGAAVALGASALIMLFGSLVFGQMNYRSIESPIKTAILYVTIIALCIGNVVACEGIALRISLIAAGLGTCVALYGKRAAEFTRTRLDVRKGE
ncbi:lipopolysaccharide biosynthesis protein [Adlercreutzia sp. ZJ242]|uniref:lipopolysaccharide biosynthesis protein n=1 Tax=Adlercreutzia sp. ZJ242 TaxID=2709409 RepID=UPI0013ED1C9E|nr:oligosaccharide flippase family protein [Adlercreutzia sp. ZJ242]